MFDTRPKPMTDPKHLDEFDRIFGHGNYAKDKEECCSEKPECGDKKECDCDKP